MENGPILTKWQSVKTELERLKDKFRPYADVKPRPTMIRLIVLLDEAIKEIERLTFPPR